MCRGTEMSQPPLPRLVCFSVGENCRLVSSSTFQIMREVAAMATRLNSLIATALRLNSLTQFVP
jgi:hypothetical protein